MKINDENLKIILYIIGIIIVFYILKNAISSIKTGIDDIFGNIFGDSKEEKQEKQEEINREIQKVNEAKKQAEIYAQKEFPSFKNSTMVDLSAKLYKAKKPWYETNDTKAFNYVINSMKNNTDFYRLVQFFGVRDGKSLKPWIAENFDADYFNKWMRENRPKVNFFV